MVEPQDLALFERDELGSGALVLDCLPRLGQLDHVGGEERHALAFSLSATGKPFRL